MPNMLSKLSAQACISSWLTGTLSKVRVQLTLEHADMATAEHARALVCFNHEPEMGTVR